MIALIHSKSSQNAHQDKLARDKRKMLPKNKCARTVLLILQPKYSIILRLKIREIKDFKTFNELMLVNYANYYENLFKKLYNPNKKVKNY